MYTKFNTGKGIESFRYDPVNGATAGGWNSLERDETAYYEYRIAPDVKTSIKLTDLNFDVSLNLVNMRTSIHYSLDGFNNSDIPISHSIFVGKNSSSGLHVQTDLIVNYPDTLSVRIYGWSAPTPAVTFFTRDVEFKGVFVEKDLTRQVNTISNSRSSFTVSNSVTNVNCFGQNTGSINLTVTGGTAPIKFNWTGPNSFSASTEDVNGLIAGTYHVIITDDDLTKEEFDFTVEDPAAPIAISENHIDVNCFGATSGTINITVSGGTAPYTYIWNGPSGFTASTEDLSNRPAGTYNVVVTDSKSCTQNKIISISQPTAALTSSETHENVSCFGTSSGSIDLTTTGGTTPYQFSWTGPAGFTANTEDLLNISTGTYIVTVTDANNCTTSRSITIGQPAQLSASSTKVDVLCSGNSTGSINLSVVGGTPGYTYSWSGPTSFNASTQNISGLPVGTYDVAVTDAKGCKTNNSVTLVQPSALSVTTSSNSPVCQGSTLDLVSTPAGGSGIYSYIWTGPNGFNRTLKDPSITNISLAGGGTYTLSVKDQNNCIVSVNTIITVTPSVVPSVISINKSTICNGESVVLNATLPTGGSGNYSYQWQSSPNGNNTWTDISGASNLSFSNPSLTSTTSFRLAITSAPCVTVYSNVITIEVQKLLVPGTIGNSQTICNNNTPTALASTNDGSVLNACGTQVWKWETSFDGATWSTSGTITKGYAFTTPLTQTNHYRRSSGYVCNGVTCYSEPTPAITITVQSTVIPGIISSDEIVCSNSAPQQFTGTLATGSGNITYQWQSSTNGTTFTNIAGATGKDYTPGALTFDTWYRRIAISTLNGFTCSENSNVIKITVNNLSPGTINSSQILCEGSLPLGFTSTLASGSGIITYQWQSSVTNATTGFSNIPSAISAAYTSTTTNTTWYQRIATSTYLGKECSTPSNIVEITRVNIDPGSISTSVEKFCGSVDPSITATNATVSSPSIIQGYQWQQSTDNVTFTDIPSANVVSYDPPPVSKTTYFRRIVIVKTTVGTNSLVCSETSNVSRWEVYPVPTLASIPAISVCEKQPITITASASNITGTPTYKLSYVSGTYIISDIVNNTGIFYLDPSGLATAPVGRQEYLITVTNGDAGACSASIPITVHIWDVPNLTLTASCASGGTGSILMTGTASYPSGATVEYRIIQGPTGIGSWTTNPLFNNLPVGTYIIEARTVVNPSKPQDPQCTSNLSGDVRYKTVETFNYEVCQNGTIPVGEGLRAVSLCITWANGQSQTKEVCTKNNSDTYYRSNSATSYVAGPLVRYEEYITFKAPDGRITFKDCSDNPASYSIYKYYFDPDNPDVNFVTWVPMSPNPCDDRTVMGLDPLAVYVFVLNSSSSTTNTCTKLQIIQGFQIEVANSYGPVSWYNSPTSTTPIATGSVFNPLPHIPGGTTCPGTYVFYAGCNNEKVNVPDDCREPAIFTVNPIPTVVASNTTACSGSPMNIPLSSIENCKSTIIDPSTVTYEWTAKLIKGSATGFNNCTTNCGSIINQTIVSTDPNICPVIEYTIRASVGGCYGPWTTIQVTIINSTSMKLPVVEPTRSFTCKSQVPAPEELISEHACLGQLKVKGVDTDNGGSGCPDNPLIITRTWHFVDACRDETITQTLTVIDNVPPTFTTPADITIYTDIDCEALDGPLHTGDVTNASDNCTTANLNRTYTDKEIIGNCGDDFIKKITRTWRLADACGNVTTHDQIITVKDNIPPSFNLKGPFSFCVLDITEAIVDRQPEPLTDFTPARPDWYIIDAGNTELDIVDIDDNCSSLNNLKIDWTINFSNGHTAISGTGQPSTYGSEIKLWGTTDFTEVEHTITYTLTDCGMLKTTKTQTIKILPRPKMEKDWAKMIIN